MSNTDNDMFEVIAKPAGSEEKGYCVSNAYGQSDLFQWLEATGGDLATLGGDLTTLFLILSPLLHSPAAAEEIDFPLPDSLRALFEKEVEMGRLGADDLACWRGGVVMAGMAMLRAAGIVDAYEEAVAAAHRA